MSSNIDVRVPDIGDFKNIPVIEIFVKPGDAVKKNDSLVTLESDKAAMEVPSSADGNVVDVKVKLGDKVSEGTVIVTLASDAAPAQAGDSANVAPQSPAAPPTASSRAERSGVVGTTLTPGRAQDAQERPREGQPSSTAASGGDVVELTVPDVGDFENIPVIEVLIKPGDTIEKDASLIVLESDKASMEVPSTAAGVVQDVKLKVGDKVSKGTVIATLQSASPAPQSASSGPSTDARSAQDDGRGAAAPQSQAAAATLSSRAERSGVVSTMLTPGRAQDAQERPREGQPVAAGGVVHASPSIRRLARELGVALQSVRPTGPNGRVTREDVHGFVKSAMQSGGAGSGGGASFAGLPAWPKVDFAQYGEIERVPLSRIKKLSGPNLHRNWVQIPHITNYDEADVTDLEAFRNDVNAERAKAGGAKLTMLAFLVKASVAALQKFADFNASLDGDALVHKHYYNIGFAADTPNGLVVPVLKNAQSKGLLDIAQESSDLAARARDGKLALGDMQGGTFTISSIGGIGGTAFTQIVNAPEVAILGATRAAIKPVWNGREFTPRLMLPVSVSYDHRVIDGASAARFLVYLTGLLKDFRRVLL